MRWSKRIMMSRCNLQTKTRARSSSLSAVRGPKSCRKGTTWQQCIRAASNCQGCRGCCSHSIISGANFLSWKLGGVRQIPCRCWTCLANWWGWVGLMMRKMLSLSIWLIALLPQPLCEPCSNWVRVHVVWMVLCKWCSSDGYLVFVRCVQVSARVYKHAARWLVTSLRVCVPYEQLRVILHWKTQKIDLS